MGKEFDLISDILFSFRIRLPSTRIRRVRQRIRIYLLRVYWEIFESGKKKLRIHNYLDTPEWTGTKSEYTFRILAALTFIHSVVSIRLSHSFLLPLGLFVFAFKKCKKT